MPPLDGSTLLRLLQADQVVRVLLAGTAEIPCHLVGGGLRDRLLGLASRDLDAVVERQGEEIARRLAVALSAHFVPLGGDEFAAYRLVGEGFVLDLWDRQGTPLEADLARRDFTVNSFALDLATGDLIDPFQGIADLNARLLRATSERSFHADPLRVLRLARLAVQLPGFTAEPGTLRLAREAAPGLSRVAPERIREELGLILAHPEAHRAVALLVESQVYPGLWLGRPGVPEEAGEVVAGLKALAEAAKEVGDLVPEAEVDPVLARWALLFAHLPPRIPESAGTSHTSQAGPKVSAESAGTWGALLRPFAAAGYLSRRTARQVAAVLAWDRLPEDKKAGRRLLYELGDLWATAAAYLGARAQIGGGWNAWQAGLQNLATLLRRHGPGLLHPPRLVTGEDVQRILGLAPGPAVGRALAAIREAQIEGRIESREEALEFLRGLRPIPP